MKTNSIIHTAVVLLASATVAPAIVSTSVNINFSDLPAVTGPVYGQPGVIPNGYAGLDWSNFDYRPGKSHGLGPGFSKGTITPSLNVAFNPSGGASIITSSSPIDLLSLYLTAGYVNGLVVEVEAFRNGVTAPVFDQKFTLTTAPQDEILTGVTDVNEIKLISLGLPSTLPVVHALDTTQNPLNNEFVLGGISLTPTPRTGTPDGGSTMLLLSAAVGGLTWLRRKIS